MDRWRERSRDGLKLGETELRKREDVNEEERKKSASDREGRKLRVYSHASGSLRFYLGTAVL